MYRLFTCLYRSYEKYLIFRGGEELLRYAEAGDVIFQYAKKNGISIFGEAGTETADLFKENFLTEKQRGKLACFVIALAYCQPYQIKRETTTFVPAICSCSDFCPTSGAVNSVSGGISTFSYCDVTSVSLGISSSTSKTWGCFASCNITSVSRGTSFCEQRVMF